MGTLSFSLSALRGKGGRGRRLAFQALHSSRIFATDKGTPANDERIA